MAYAEIGIGDDGLSLTVDGVPYESSSWYQSRPAMEDWSTSNTLDHGLRRDDNRHEWPRELLPFDHIFDVLGNDKQAYQETFDSTEIGSIKKRWLYACGDTKARVERDFDKLVVPVLKRDIPDVVPKGCKLSSSGIKDPWADSFMMPKYMHKEDAPCIELRYGYAKTMPIDAIMPFVAERGHTMFGCRMRYSKEGRLKKAEVTILRKGQWEVTVSFSAAGVGKVMSCRRV